MAKNLTNAQKRCEECEFLKIHNGKWFCEECFNQPCEEIDDCPIGVTLEECEVLEAKAKDNKVNLGAKAEVKKERKPRERKPDEEKEQIIAEMADFLQNVGENVKITNISKIIEFDIGENHYKIDVIRQRKPKKQAFFFIFA